MKRLISIWLCLLLLGSSAFVLMGVDDEVAADTRINGGNISVDTTWTLANSPYFIEGNVIVDLGVELTIEPGVEVKFDGYYSLTSYGTVNATGNSTNKIAFTSNNTSPMTNDWYGIVAKENGTVNLEYCNITYAHVGVFLDGDYGKDLQYSNITNSIIAYSDWYGIYLEWANHTDIINNTLYQNNNVGIVLSHSHLNNISNNNASSTRDGISAIFHSNFNIISNNNVSYNYGTGIDIDGYGNHVTNNELWSNLDNGIILLGSNDTFIDGNVVWYSELGLTVGGGHLEYYNNTVTTTNKINGNPVYYYFNLNSQIVNIPSIGGHVTIAGCENLTIKNCTVQNADYIELAFSNNITVPYPYVSNCSYGINLYWSSRNNILGANLIGNNFGLYLKGGWLYDDKQYNLIENCNISFNKFNGTTLEESSNNIFSNNSIINNDKNGIKLSFANDNKISQNNFSDNGGYGIYLTNSNNNEIYHNYLDNNVNQAYDYSSISGNSWDNGYPNGGNYWGDYSGTDNYHGPNQDISGKDWIGDTPYNISGGVTQDQYPILYYPNDIVAPTSNISQISPYWNYNTPLTITATATDNTIMGNVGLWYRYSTDNTTWGTWKLLNIDYSSPWFWDYYFPSEGYYEFFSIASDIAGNVELMKSVGEASCFYSGSAIIPIMPIRINSNSDFDFSHGVTSGNGTELNPWLIENYIIDGTGYGNCIYIGNTTENFIVKNCYLSKASGNTTDPPFGNYGLILYNATNGRLNNITVTQNEWDGVHLFYSSNIIIENITAVDNPGHDICLESSNNNYVFNNNVSSKQNIGINLIASESNKIFNNRLEGKNGGGIALWSHSKNNIINNNDFTGTELSIWSSSNNSVTNNTFTSSSWTPYYSIGLYDSDNNSITDNVCNDTSTYLIFLRESDNNSLTNNIISQSENGIYIENSKNNEVNNNSISDIIDYGIQLKESSSQTLTNNTMTNCSLMLEGDVNHWDSHTIAESNSIDGKPVYYRNIQSDMEIPLGAGEIILGNCDNMTIKNQKITDSKLAILIGHSRNIRISNNNISNISNYGIILTGSQTSHCEISNNTMTMNSVSILMKDVNSSSVTHNFFINNGNSIIVENCKNNTFTKNYIINNSWGIRLTLGSGGNTVFLNVIVDNSHGVYIDQITRTNLFYYNGFINNTLHVSTWGYNYWYKDYPTGGNYWSDYTGTDNYSGIGQNITGSDGIGDKYYTVYSWIEDLYPLMWIPDWEAPESSVEMITPYWQNNQINITASVIDNGYSGVSNISLWYRDSTDNVSWGDWTLYETDLSSPWSWGFIASEDGYYEFYSISQDNASNFELPPNSPDACLGFDTTPPTSDAGLDHVVQIGEVVSFSSSGCSDNILIANYSWNFEYNSSTYILYGESPEFIFWISGNYTITLNVTDAAGNWASNDMIVLVEPKELQIIEEASYLWVLVILIVFGALGMLFLLNKRANKTGGETAEEPTIETEKCPECGFDIETGSACPFCVEEDALDPTLEGTKP